MNGQQYYNSLFSNYIQRRSFLIKLGLITAGIFLNGCIKKVKSKKYQISGILNGPNAVAGHILRDKIEIPPATKTRKVHTLIIGAGISGLSAARWLQKHGKTDFELLELEDHFGGNSSFGTNDVSSYPLGAHYITIANTDDHLMVDFLQELGVITHFENQLPYYNDFHLTFDPEERLLINGEWQEGLIPDFGVPKADKEQIKKFLNEVDRLKQTKGNDGKYVFNIPISASSTDENFTKLDEISFKGYLQDKGYHSPYLLWYVNYACKDDYGQRIERVSAWAGLHYFASRRGMAANAEDNAVLTWPEGNGWLMQKMADKLKKHISKSMMCYEIKELPNNKLEALVYDLKNKETVKIEANKIILATPQYVNHKILKNIKRLDFDSRAFNYTPWLIANITVEGMPNAKGVELCWDNVAYDTPSVGYVNATHQKTDLYENQKVLTFYLPLCDFEPAIARVAAYTRTYEQWLDIIIPQLNYIHPGIEKNIKQLDFWIWGHGMISPNPHFIFGENVANARKPIKDKIYFAHTDLSGISIFEEAFHQGIHVAEEILKNESI
jgi:protoporphyrinogen oxidase